MNQNHYKGVWVYSVVGHEKILKSQKASQDEKTIICKDLLAKKHSQKIKRNLNWLFQADYLTQNNLDKSICPSGHQNTIVQTLFF